MRTWTERRHHRDRVIAKRVRIIANAWGYTDLRYNREPGRLAKYNLNCGCQMCQANKTKRPEHPFDWRSEDA